MKEVQFINPLEVNFSRVQLEKLVCLINDVFFVAEGVLWPQDGTYYRTTLAEVESYIAKGELRFAMINEEIAGIVKVIKRNSDLGCFGMLVVDPKFRQHKLGSQLVELAENVCIAQGMSRIELELLVPNDFILEDKEFLREWYNRIGYKYEEKFPFESLYPSHAHLIQTSCRFEIMRKKLV